MKRIIRLTEGDLHKIVKNTVKRIIKESEDNGISDYTHFAVNKNSNLIVNGWDYSEEDPAELRRYKNDFFFNDLIDNEFNPREYKILTRKGCVRQGIDPDDELNYWSNNGEVSLAQEKNQNNM